MTLVCCTEYGVLRWGFHEISFQGRTRLNTRDSTEEYKKWAIDMVNVVYHHLKLDTLGLRHYKRHVNMFTEHRGTGLGV